jgi:uncharacterized membrane protein YidH (DUF202 family)
MPSNGVSRQKLAMMTSIGRSLIVIGIVLLVLGLILTHGGFWHFLRLGRLPGDLSIKRGNYQFYFPITTCIIISLFLTLIIYLFKK